MLAFRRVVVGLLAVVCAVSAMNVQAQEKKKKKGADRAAAPRAINQLKGQLEKLDLTAEQKTKVEEILKTHAPKLEAAQKKADEALSPEQRKARAEALSKARGEGKKGKELQESVNEAVKATDEQKSKMASANKELQEATQALRKEVVGVLTAEQKAKLGAGAKKK